MKFSINTQQDILNNWMKSLIDRMYQVGNINLMPNDTKYCIQSLNAVYKRFTDTTKSNWGYFKSFIPFTTNYNYRVTYHNIVLKLCDKLNDFQTKITEAEKQQLAKNRRSSAPAVIQYVYSSPINSFNDKKDNRRNSINPAMLHNAFYSKRHTLFS